MSISFARNSSRHQRDYSPVSWLDYFDEAHDICIEDGNNEEKNVKNDQDTQGNFFRVYLRNFNEPFAPKREFGQALNPTHLELTKDQVDKYSSVPTLVTLHGGGYSALTWCQFVRHIEQYCQCRILSIDLRGHGDTKTSDDDKIDIDTLVEDVISVTHKVHQACGFEATPKIVLIGHSMGGAIAVKCSTICLDYLPSLAGFVIIDVVEGTAKDALPLMLSVIQTRPIKFPSLSNAIEWSVRSGMTKNLEAARVSMPGNLINIKKGQSAIHDVATTDITKEKLLKTIKSHKYHVNIECLIAPSKSHASLPPKLPLPQRVRALKEGVTLPPCPLVMSTISEPAAQTQPQDVASKSESIEKDDDDGDKDEDGYRKPPDILNDGYSWRTNLIKTQPFWDGWFDGLSDQLLQAPVQGKFLLLAGIDRLDKTLTIGHMQGKFMMKVLPKCGHAVHEDVPEQVAQTIGDFLVRNKFSIVIGG